MSDTKPRAQQRLHRRAIPFITVFFVAFFVYIWLRIDPRLVYHAQCPVFKVDRAFFVSFWERPGGPAEYVCAWLSQFWTRPWLGALIITGTVGAISLATSSFIRRMGGTPVAPICLVPAVVLLILHSHYDHPLILDVRLLIVLVSIVVYGAVFPRMAAPRLAVFLLMCGILYYLVTGAVALFVILSALLEGLTRRRPGLGLSYALVGLAGVFAAGKYLFGASAIDTYARLLPFHPDVGPSAASAALCAFFLLAAIILPWWSHRRNGSLAVRAEAAAPSLPEHAEPPDRGKWLQGVGQWVLLFVFGVAAALFSFDRDGRGLIRIDYFARHKMWPNVLAEARRLPASRYTVATHWDVNRALFHTGRLGYDMFAYPQGDTGAQDNATSLLCDNSPASTHDLPVLACMNLGEVFFELGRVNESLSRGHEALGYLGEQPLIIQRLFLIYLVKQDADPARTCLNALGKHLLWKRQVEEYRRRLKGDPFLSRDPQIERIRSVMEIPRSSAFVP
jgi:hypothetical protein